MNNIVKGAVITIGILIALIVVNIICNKTGHELDSLYTGVVTSILSMAIYDRVSDAPAKKQV